MFFSYQTQLWIILDLVDDNNTAKEQCFSDFIKHLQMVSIFISKTIRAQEVKDWHWPPSMSNSDAWP